MLETMTVYESILAPKAKHLTSRVISHEEIALRAYYHWERRGKPFGSPEVDWYWAIEDLNQVFHIVGCNHGIQTGIGGFADFDGTDQNEQRGHFSTMVENICVNHATQIVLEEDGDPEETAAKQIADQRKIPWRDINTSNNDKDRMGIPRDYVSGAYGAEEKREWHRQREQFMLERINEYGKGAQTLLVICGFVHVQPLAALLAHCGTVRQTDYRTLGSYRRDIFTGDAR
jgi:hypothetical protein